MFRSHPLLLMWISASYFNHLRERSTVTKFLTAEQFYSWFTVAYLHHKKFRTRQAY